jgi:hypothetical protein
MALLSPALPSWLLLGSILDVFLQTHLQCLIVFLWLTIGALPCSGAGNLWHNWGVLDYHRRKYTSPWTTPSLPLGRRRGT